jgi:hypothetical protein
MIYEPSILNGAFSVLIVAFIFLIVIGLLLWQGYSKVLTFMIFLNGMNVIIRIMMMLSTSFSEEGVFNLPFTLFSSIGAGISLYLMLRLDEVDVRQHMSHF